MLWPAKPPSQGSFLPFSWIRRRVFFAHCLHFVLYRHRADPTTTFSLCITMPCHRLMVFSPLSQTFSLHLIPRTLWEAGVVSMWPTKTPKLRASVVSYLFRVEFSFLSHSLAEYYFFSSNSLCWRYPAASAALCDITSLLPVVLKLSISPASQAQWEGAPSGHLCSFIWAGPRTCKMG